MAQVRETIELLVKILRGNGTSKIKAESFRLAKFNNDTAVSVTMQHFFYTNFKTLTVWPGMQGSNLLP